MQFRNDIQGLRALAFIMVFIFHLNHEWLPGGFLGVDLFFVISGYLITTIILSDIGKEKFSFVQFYIKRTKRIVPAYFVLLLAVAIAGSYIYLFTDIQYLRGTILRSALFISNNLFASGNSYFGAKLSENPLLHTWSLAIEMQFYLILPFIIYFFKDKLKIVLPIIILGTTAYSTYHLYMLDNKSSMYFSLFARIPEFMVGAYFAVLFKKGLTLSSANRNIVAILSLIILIGCAIFISEESTFPGLLALVPCVASGFLLVSNKNTISDFFSKPLPFSIGQLSYSLYLWHWPILAFMRYKNDSYHLTSFQIIAAIVLTFMLATLSYNLIEKNLGQKNTQVNLRTLGLLVILLIISYFGIIKISEGHKIPDLYTKPILGLPSHYDGVIEKFGDLKKNDSVVLIGDSHALMLKPFLNQVGLKNHFSFNTLTCDAFPALRGINRNELNQDARKHYDATLKYVPKTDSIIEKSKVIILNTISINHYPSTENAVYRLAKSLRKNQNLILIATFPKVSKNALKTNNNFVKTNDAPNQLIRNIANQKKLQKIASKFSNVYYYDISKSKIFRSAPYINDTVSYYDSSHINHYGSEKLAEDLGDEFYSLLKSFR